MEYSCENKWVQATHNKMGDYYKNKTEQNRPDRNEYTLNEFRLYGFFKWAKQN